jgi:hypothetical protein
VNSLNKAIFWGGLWCGILDFLSAVTAWRVSPVRIGQSIAGGLLGRTEAVQGGWRTALLGVFLHFVIAFGAATVYVVASRRLRFLTQHAVIAGLLYGWVVFLFMNMVVLPLSALHADPLRWTSFSPWPTLVTGPIGHPFLVGLPIALAACKYAPYWRDEALKEKSAGAGPRSA